MQQACMVLLQQIHLSSPEVDFHGNQTKREHSRQAKFVKQGVAKTTKEVSEEGIYLMITLEM